jgi:hypothetical protein
MQLDIRMPTGLLFTFLGIIITIFGFATNGAPIYQHSLNININIYSGICLLVFGVAMLVMAIRAQKGTKKAS